MRIIMAILKGNRKVENAVRNNAYIEMKKKTSEINISRKTAYLHQVHKRWNENMGALCWVSDLKSNCT